MESILIIDDDESMRFVLQSMLMHEGYQTLEAMDGAEGLRLCEAEHPSLVITDLVMPNKEGIETIMELRASFPHLRIVAISGGGGLDPSTYLCAAEMLGADRTLRKPFRSKELISIVRELLSEAGCREAEAPPPVPSPTPIEP